MKGLRSFSLLVPDFFPLKAALVGIVAMDETGKLLTGVSAQGADFQVGVLRVDHFEKSLAILLDFVRSGFDHHAGSGLGGAGGDGIADSFHLDNAEAAAAKGFESVVITKSGDRFPHLGGDLVNGLAFGEGDFLTVDGHRQLLHRHFEST